MENNKLVEAFSIRYGWYAYIACPQNRCTWPEDLKPDRFVHATC